ncbi:FAD/NAD(P)-binding domain-containing protein [Stipitochalara longipes BDJ]|nr:FAD/NAD(P)-binding domain-containing protein [Stipitochalara longipes BDJ]
MSAPSKHFRIAIVGGGIGGLFTALSLNWHCKGHVQISVYEQASEYKEIGAGVGIGANAAKLLHKVGLGEALNNIMGNTEGIWVAFRRFDTGGEVVTVHEERSQKFRNSPVQRAEFLDLLLAAVKERGAASLFTKKCCKHIKKCDSHMNIEFTDGTFASADLIVACDGIHSAVRSQYATDRPIYSGRIAWRGLVELKSISEGWPFPTTSVQWMAQDRHFLVFPISRNNLLNVVGFVTKDEAEMRDLRESWSCTGDIADMRKDFAGFEETVQQVIGKLTSTPSKWLLNDRDPLAEWVYEDGQVVLLGDAAHAMLPYQVGAGAGQAIEDGYILGRALQDFFRTPGDIKQWLHLYQAVRLPRAQKVQETTREAGDIYEMQSPDMKGLSFEDCMPLVKSRIEGRMKWIWTDNIDAAYDAAKAKLKGR